MKHSYVVELVVPPGTFVARILDAPKDVSELDVEVRNSLQTIRLLSASPQSSTATSESIPPPSAETSPTRFLVAHCRDMDTANRAVVCFSAEVPMPVLPWTDRHAIVWDKCIRDACGHFQ